MLHNSLVARTLFISSLALVVAACSGADYGSEPSASTHNKVDNGAANGDNGNGTINTIDGATAQQGIRFGVAPQWNQPYDPPAQGPANVDAVAIGDWLIEAGFTDTHDAKINKILAKKKVPYFFGYILTALTKKGLGENADCDGDPNRKLCKEGAAWVRAHIDTDIVPLYKEAARRIGLAVGATEALIHIEPDFYQFSEKAQANAFTREESNATMNKVLGAIRAGCASCKVVIDFSPWFSADKTNWATSAGDFYSGWDRSVVKYVGLTGKPFPFTEGKIDNFTYAQIATELKLPLVIIDAYTFGGGPIDVDKSWLDQANLTKAAQLGISHVFLSQQGDVAGYDAFLATRTNNGGGPGTMPPNTNPNTNPPASAVRSEGGNLDVKITPSTDRPGHACWHLNVTNKDAGGVEWRVRIQRQGTLDYVFNSTMRTEGNEWLLAGVEFNRVLEPGKTTEVGYCTNP